MAGKFGVTSYTIAGLAVLVLSDWLPTIPPLASPFTVNDWLSSLSNTA
jgi:hypothetical protein